MQENTALRLEYGQDPEVPIYVGAHWLSTSLPVRSEPWPRPTKLAAIDDYDAPVAALRDVFDGRPWLWTGRNVVFLCDMHADAEALVASLVASGTVARTGPGSCDFELLPGADGTRYVMGGDCFDKGPSNLELLRALRHLVDQGADLVLLAGNHDLRTFLGIAAAGRKEPHLAHLFVRMGKKTVSLFEEIFRCYVEPSLDPTSLNSDSEVRERLFPDESWWSAFPVAVEGFIPAPTIAKELRRIREKMREVEERYAEIGMSLGMVEATLDKARELFLEPGGEFYWFFERVQLAHQEGSVLFVHAGVCDQTAEILRSEGVEGLNRRFRELLESDPFTLYNGVLGNVFRTKYRANDRPFSEEGTLALRRAGIGAIVHGHRNVTRGHRLTLRRGVVNFECDCSVDRATRVAEGLEGVGATATVFRPDAVIVGVSSDHHAAKVFDPSSIASLVAIV
jgi:hypothetical protein